MPDPAEQPPFRIGLCLAGAVTAGAYTAGVMDFLIETLQRWEQHRGREGVPTHRVEIPVIGGASAGGMTGILTAATMKQRFAPVPTPPVTPPDNPFYNIWVEMTDADMIPHLLDTGDIKKAGKVVSVLNSGFIDTLAGRVVASGRNTVGRPQFFDEHLKLFVTLSNLEGFGFSLPFSGAGAAQPHDMRLHNDYACFVLDKEQTAYANDGWIPLHFAKGVNTRIAEAAAMATGAFPGGLVARKLTREARYVNDNAWIRYKLNASIPPAAALMAATTRPLAGMAGNQSYTSLNVDGGLINNEPFELVRNLLFEKIGLPDRAAYDNDSKKYCTFRDTVLMIDPFPSPTPDFNGSLGLGNVLENTLSVLLAQAGNKPDIHHDAVDRNCPSQFMIAPSRDDIRGLNISGSKALACGAIGGFSGFLHKDYRIHDYFLGRSNCQSFLQKYFTVPADTTNQIFVAGYLGMVGRHRLPDPAGGAGRLPVIPVLDASGNPLPVPAKSPMPVAWPTGRPRLLERYQEALRRRVRMMLEDSMPKMNCLQRLLVIYFATGHVARETMGKIDKELTSHEL